MGIWYIYMNTCQLVEMNTRKNWCQLVQSPKHVYFSIWYINMYIKLSEEFITVHDRQFPSKLSCHTRNEASNAAHNVLPRASCQIRKIAGVHAPRMPDRFPRYQGVSDPDMHHSTCVTHVPWCMPGSLTSGCPWSRRRGKRSRHSRRTHAQPAVLRIW